MNVSVTKAAARPRLVSIAWPMLAELLLGFGVGLLGLWLAASLSDTTAAAFALSNQVQVAFFLLFRIVSMGVSVVVTQYLGAGNRAGADQTARAALGASTWLGLSVALVVFSSAGMLLSWVNAPRDVLTLAQPYLQALAVALLLDAWNASMASVMRAHLRTRDVMLNILSMHGLHLLLCFPLMRGLGIVPAFGLVGFALALGLSRALGLGLHLLLWRWRLNLVPTARDWWTLHWKRLEPVLQIGLPGAAENVAYRVAMLVSVSVVAGLGAQALATQSYAFQLMHIVVLFSLSIGLASEVLVGHLVGAGSLRKAHRLLRKSLVLGLLVSVSVALLVAGTARWTLHLFTQDPQIIASATTLLWITVLLEPGRTCNVIIINALRAAGDARFPVLAGAASMLFVMAGGSWFLGVHFQLGLVGVWIAYAADEWVRGLSMAVRWFSHGWLGAAKSARRRAIQHKLVSTEGAV